VLKKLRDEQLIDVKPTVWVFFRKEKYEAAVVHVNDEHDLALLKVERRVAPFFQLAKSSEVSRGTKVIACGFPAAAQAALSGEEGWSQAARQSTFTNRVEDRFEQRYFEYVRTDGTVSRLMKEERGRHWIQHSAATNPGNSGGPLLTEDGTVIGITTAGAPESQGLFAALSLPQLRQVIEKHVPGTVWK